ncbi:GNAT family N-acetyltransferase [Streptomyces sp. NPDC088785]|uniref:GNAT family N-acetyltransferase n=1 Tax=Streptomyces sp. NPDC088785 TaxID=3365897 RepID=UPI0037FC0C31
MPELQRLNQEHAAALLVFERENRAFFAASIPDRGDAYFADFAERHAALLAEQDTGAVHLHVLVGEAGAILGRFNLVDVRDGGADLGFRLARAATGRGLATAAVHQVLALAAADHGLTRVTASAARVNGASRAVLARTGFRPTGETTLSGKPGITYVRELTG